jgi:hypothetical protein
MKAKCLLLTNKRIEEVTRILSEKSRFSLRLFQYLNGLVLFYNIAFCQPNIWNGFINCFVTLHVFLCSTFRKADRYFTHEVQKLDLTDVRKQGSVLKQHRQNKKNLRALYRRQPQTL